MKGAKAKSQESRAKMRYRNFVGVRAMAVLTAMAAMAAMTAMAALPAMAASIRHGDVISFKYVCFQNETGYIYNFRPKGGLIAKVCDQETTFRIYKDPYYKSKDDVILAGNTIRLVPTSNLNIECGIEPNRNARRIVCNKNRALRIPLRLMDKHGADKIPIDEVHEVKMRGVGSKVDCNGAPIQCMKKTSKTNEYGFVVVKTI